MADSDPALSPPPTVAPLSLKKENVMVVNSKLADLNETRSELLTRIQGLKQDLQNWRSKLDSQVTIYRGELSELKQSLNVEVEQLRSEFQELKSTLQQQQEDVAVSLRNLGMQEGPESVIETQNPQAEIVVKEVQDDTLESDKET
ncbi:uncharacterized protein [Aristolochia californica]|uniref:uncharacterized protein n=1 Tax=Aristolochia californica TaxID=171875 RepID=UPI0035E0F6A4